MSLTLAGERGHTCTDTHAGALSPPVVPLRWARRSNATRSLNWVFVTLPSSLWCSVAPNDTFLIVPVQFPGGFSNPGAGTVPLDMTMTRTPESSCPVDPCLPRAEQGEGRTPCPGFKPSCVRVFEHPAPGCPCPMASTLPYFWCSTSPGPWAPARAAQGGWGWCRQGGLEGCCAHPLIPNVLLNATKGPSNLEATLTVDPLTWTDTWLGGQTSRVGNEGFSHSPRLVLEHRDQHVPPERTGTASGTSVSVLSQ